MAIFDVTFARFGYMKVEAETREEAIRIADKTATTEKVTWSEDWPATDAEMIEDSEND